MKFIGIFAIVVAGFVGLTVVGAALGLITIPWLKFTSQVQMERDIVTKTYDADNAIYNYHWFQERAESIKATSAKVKIADESLSFFVTSAGPRATWTFEDKTEAARLAAVAQGLKSQYEDLVAEYNARAKEVDRNIFLDLPLFFSLEAY